MYHPAGEKSGSRQEVSPANDPSSKKHLSSPAAIRKQLCQARDCCVDLRALGRPYCIRKGVCPDCMKAASVHLEGYGDTPFRFCFQCAKLEPLALFQGAKRSCSTSLAKRQSPEDQPYKASLTRNSSKKRKHGRKSSSSTSKRLHNSVRRLSSSSSGSETCAAAADMEALAEGWMHDAHDQQQQQQWIEPLLPALPLESLSLGWQECPAATSQAVQHQQQQQQQQQQQLLLPPALLLAEMDQNDCHVDLDDCDLDLLFDTSVAPWGLGGFSWADSRVTNAAGTAAGAVLLPDTQARSTAPQTWPDLPMVPEGSFSVAVTGLPGLSSAQKPGTTVPGLSGLSPTPSLAPLQPGAGLSFLPTASGLSGLSPTPSLEMLQSGVWLSGLSGPGLMSEQDPPSTPQLSITAVLTESSLLPDLAAPSRASGWQGSNQAVPGSGPSLAPGMFGQMLSGSLSSLGAPLPKTFPRPLLASGLSGQQLQAPSLASGLPGRLTSPDAALSRTWSDVPGFSLTEGLSGHQLQGPSLASGLSGPLARLEAALSRSLSETLSEMSGSSPTGQHLPSPVSGLSGPLARLASGLPGRQASVTSSSGSLPNPGLSIPALAAPCDQGFPSQQQQQQQGRVPEKPGYASTRAATDHQMAQLTGQQLQVMIELELQTTAVQTRQRIFHQQQQQWIQQLGNTTQEQQHLLDIQIQ